MVFLAILLVAVASVAGGIVVLLHAKVPWTGRSVVDGIPARVIGLLLLFCTPLVGHLRCVWP
jgi:hypothetical protein